MQISLGLAVFDVDYIQQFVMGYFWLFLIVRMFICCFYVCIAALLIDCLLLFLVAGSSRPLRGDPSRRASRSLRMTGLGCPQALRARSG